MTESGNGLGTGARIRRLLRRLFTPPLERFLSLCTVALVILGVLLRSRGYLLGDTIAFWLDETQWAIYLTEQPLSEHLIRPIGFMALSKAFAGIFGPTETALRFLPWLAGVLTTVMAPFLARRLYIAPAARLLLVAIIALHPGAIDLAREYKPYAVSLFFHAALMFMAARYSIDRTSRALGQALAVVVLSVLFAQDVIFAYPGFFLTLGIVAWPRWKWHGIATGAVGLFVLSLVLAQYVFIWSRIPEDETQYWANKYDVFLSENSSSSYLSWWFDKYWNMAAFPGFRRGTWSSGWLSRGEVRGLAHADNHIWLLLHVLGVLAILWRRKLVHALLLLLPLGIMTVFNYFGHWPYGAFRTNLFVLAYMAPIACAALDARVDRLARWTGAVPAFVLVLAPMLMFEKEWNERKRALTSNSHFPAALEWMVEEQGAEYDGKPELLILDRWACDPFDFYTKYHPRVSRTLGPELVRRFEPLCLQHDAQIRRTLKKLRSRGQRAWLLAGKPWLIDRMRRRDLKDFRQVRRAWIGNHAVFLFQRR